MTKELSSADRAILEDDGVSLPSRYQRKKRKCDLPTDSGVEVTGRGETSAAAAHTVSGTHSEQWEEMKQYFDPNPQLKGAEQGRYGVKVSTHSELHFDDKITYNCVCHFILIYRVG